MNNTIFKQLTALQKILLYFIITFFSVVIFSFLGVKLVDVFFEINQSELSNVSGFSLNKIRGLKLMTLFSHLGMFIFPSIIFMFIAEFSFFSFFRGDKSTHLSWRLIPIIFILITLISGLLGELNQMIDFGIFSKEIKQWVETSQVQRDAIVIAFIGPTWKSLCLNIFLIAFIPAIGEELVFRGVFQSLFIQTSNRKHISILFVAFVFAFIHFQFLDFLPRFFLGITYGYIFFYSKNIGYSMLLHFSNNLVALLFLHFNIQLDFNDYKIEQIIVVILCIIALFFFYKRNKLKLK